MTLRLVCDFFLSASVTGVGVGGGRGARGGKSAMSIVTESAAVLETMRPGERGSSSVVVMMASGAHSGREASSWEAGSTRKVSMDVCTFSFAGCFLAGEGRGVLLGSWEGAGGQGEEGGDGVAMTRWGGGAGRKEESLIDQKVHSRV